jgi:hypothetical protein
LANFGKVPIPVTHESQDRPFVVAVQRVKAAGQNSSLFSLT